MRIIPVNGLGWDNAAKKIRYYLCKNLLMLKIFATFAARKIGKILMNILAIRPFFFDRFSLQSLEGITGILAKAWYRYAASQHIGYFETNNIDVESCFHALKTAFCTYQPD